MIQKLLIKLLVGKLIILANLGGVPAKYWAIIPVGKKVLLINTYLKPPDEPAKRGR